MDNSKIPPHLLVIPMALACVSVITDPALKRAPPSRAFERRRRSDES
ncbi:MAG: hypothetical protein ACHREM_02340 [Polyangiales bacterium]